MQLARSIKVSSQDKWVSVALEFPVAKAIEKLTEEIPHLKLEAKPKARKETETP